ncbi:MAG TPA: nuclear transport factor 2 family protein [Solirubrobacterales bacterium]|nr:nuclear transport factor 2 family protein [Solirubrobacterales bacterium]
MLQSSDRIDSARAVFEAFAADDRIIVEDLFAPGLTFFSPPDPGLDREGYFERCWPGAGSRMEFEFVRLIEAGDEVVVTYEATRPDQSRFRNTEILTFEGDKIIKIEVYFGWDLPT